jgi:hypothetical protein
MGRSLGERASGFTVHLPMIFAWVFGFTTPRELLYLFDENSKTLCQLLALCIKLKLTHFSCLPCSRHTSFIVIFVGTALFSTELSTKLLPASSTATDITATSDIVRKISAAGFLGLMSLLYIPFSYSPRICQFLYWCDMKGWYNNSEQVSKGIERARERIELID